MPIDRARHFLPTDISSESDIVCPVLRCQDVLEVFFSIHPWNVLK